MNDRQGAWHLRLTSARVGLDGSFLRFLLVGATNFLIGYSVFRGLLLIPVDVAAKATICQLASFGAGIAWSFVWNRRFTFHSRERAATQARRFISLQIVLALTSAGVIGLLVDHLELNPSVSWFLVMGVLTVVNYVLCRAWAFR